MKQKRTAKVILAAVLAFVFAFATVGPAFAAAADDQGPNGNDAIVTKVADQDVQAVITKRLETGRTTTTPNAKFTFTFTPVTNVADFTYNNVTVDLASSGHENIGPVEIQLTPSMTGEEDHDNRVKIVEKESANFLAGLSFDNAGVYAYDVTENEDTYTIADAALEKMTYSRQMYRVFIYVANKSTGNGTYIQAVSVVYQRDNNGNTDPNASNADENLGQKVNPTPNPTPNPENNSPSPANSQMKFTNEYLKFETNTPPPVDEPVKKPLEIKKVVTGASSNKSQAFTFNVELKRPLVSDATAFNGAIYENGKKITNGDVTVNLTNGIGTASVQLKDGQSLIFTDTPVGTYFTVSESVPNNWDPSIVVMVNNSEVFNRQNEFRSGERVLGMNPANSVTITNKYKDTTPTGIILNNLPYIVMIGGAIVAIVALAVVKSKKKAAAE